MTFEGLIGWLWALPLFMLWFVPAQWVQSKQRQYERAVEQAGPDATADSVKWWMANSNLGRGFWLVVIAGWSITGGLVTWAAAYVLMKGPLFLQVLVGLFLLGTGWNTLTRNIAALNWLRNRGKPA